MVCGEVSRQHARLFPLSGGVGSWERERGQPEDEPLGSQRSLDGSSKDKGHCSSPFCRSAVTFNSLNKVSTLSFVLQIVRLIKSSIQNKPEPRGSSCLCRPLPLGEGFDEIPPDKQQQASLTMQGNRLGSAALYFIPMCCISRFLHLPLGFGQALCPLSGCAIAGALLGVT
ncbi:unnamed protein product [Arctogadus glacialis]